MLLLVRSNCNDEKGGRCRLSRVLQEIVIRICSAGIRVCELPRVRLTTVSAKVHAFRGFVDGLDELEINRIRAIVANEGVTHVLIDGSNLGELSRVLRQFFPSLRLICFFHNVEVDFFWGAFRAKPSLRSFVILCCNFLAERKAVRYCDTLIALTKFDSYRLGRLYGRRSSYIVPLALRDEFDFDVVEAQNQESAMLFVGGNFYANRLGLEWFIEHVMPNVEITLLIVGKGMESIGKSQSLPSNVRVIGEVDDLGTWYRKARFVIAPIFDGSGMKTKVAEALMYGKRIVGTAQAFAGYEAALPAAGWICNNSSEFIKVIQAAHLADFPAMDPSLRRLYLDHYSLEAATRHFERILSA
jgi:hypothetical protein